MRCSILRWKGGRLGFLVDCCREIFDRLFVVLLMSSTIVYRASIQAPSWRLLVLLEPSSIYLAIEAVLPMIGESDNSPITILQPSQRQDRGYHGLALTRLVWATI